MPHSSQPWGQTCFVLTESIALRPVEPADQTFLEQLYASTRVDLQQFPGDPGFVAQLIAMQQRLQTAGLQQNFPRAQHWVILQHDQAIGRLVVDIGHADVRLVDIVILPQAQGYGVGSSLLLALQQLAQHKRLALSLAVSKTNAVARRMYAKLGFCTVSSDELFDQMRWPCRAPHNALENEHAFH